MRWFGEQAERLNNTEHEAMHALVEARLELGEHQPLIPELERLIADRPLDEGLYRLLMIALYRSGRQAASLERFQQLKRVLAEELGIDPSPPLRELETAILRQEAALDAPTRVTVVTTAPIPAQLPLATRAFAPRARELARLDAMLADSDDVDSMPVTVVSGTAGAGGANRYPLELNGAKQFYVADWLGTSDRCDHRCRCHPHPDSPKPPGATPGSSPTSATSPPVLSSVARTPYAATTWARIKYPIRLIATRWSCAPSN